MKTLCALLFSSTLFPQSHDLKSEKEKLAKIEAAVNAQDDKTYLAECEALLDTHRINALAWYTCGKYLLSIKESNPTAARAKTKLAYARLKIATDDFARTGKQVYYAYDALQYMGLAMMMLGDYDRAQVHFRQVLARDNRVAAAWFNLGIVYELKGLREESMRAFDRYLRIKNAGEAQEF